MTPAGLVLAATFAVAALRPPTTFTAVDHPRL